MARNKDAIDMAKKGETERREAEKGEREAALYGKVKKMRLEQEKEALTYRVRAHGVKSVLPRPMKERPMLAKHMAAVKKCTAAQSLSDVFQCGRYASLHHFYD